MSLLVGLAGVANAQPRLAISIAQLRPVSQKPGKGAAVRWVPAEKTAPGEVLTYRLTYSNKGDEPATRAVIEDPVPKGTTYVEGSAEGAGAEITFSIDGGKTYAPPGQLFHQVRLPSGKTERRPAAPTEYTHVRWTVAKVAPGQSGQVSFRVTVNR